MTASVTKENDSKTPGISRCRSFIAPDEFCELFYGHLGRCGFLPEHEHWFNRDGFCVQCGKDGGPAVYGP